MEKKIKKLEREIKELETKLGKNRFGGLFDAAARRRDEKKLRRLQKELEHLLKTSKNQEDQ